MAKSSLLIEMIDIMRDQHGICMEELAKKLGRSERTIYRWLREISTDLNMPLTCLDGGYYLFDGQGNGHVNFDPQEMLALWMSLKSAPFTGGSPIGQYAESAWQKIRQAVAWEVIEEAKDLSSTQGVTVNATDGGVSPGIVRMLENRSTSDTVSRLLQVPKEQPCKALPDRSLCHGLSTPQLVFAGIFPGTR